METRSAITIDRSPDEIYGRFRKLEQLPSFMYHLESVEELDARRSHWVAEGPAGTKVAWDAEITEEVPGTSLAWRSVEGADVPNEGSVHLVRAPGDRGTEVHVTISYTTPLGALGDAVAKLFGEEPAQQLSDDLRRLKQLLETGEIARSQGAPLGVRTANIGQQKEAQPEVSGRATTSANLTSKDSGVSA